MKLRPQVLSAIFGIYFTTVVSGAILVASQTTGPWYDTGASTTAYMAFLITYLILLVAITLFGALQQYVKGANPSVAILAGPVIVSAACLGIASILLPASTGFLQTNYQLNTAAILILSYAWLGVAFYFAGAVGHVLQQKKASPTSPSEIGEDDF